MAEFSISLLVPTPRGDYLPKAWRLVFSIRCRFFPFHAVKLFYIFMLMCIYICGYTAPCLPKPLLSKFLSCNSQVNPGLLQFDYPTKWASPIFSSIARLRMRMPFFTSLLPDAFVPNVFCL